MPSVATIGWMRTTVARKPFAAPTSAPIEQRCRNDAPGATRCRRSRNSTWIARALTKPISGPTEMSMPPRPARITGVEAMAAPISGAASPISAPQDARLEPRRTEDEIDRKQDDQQHDGETDASPERQEARDRALMPRVRTWQRSRCRWSSLRRRFRPRPAFSRNTSTRWHSRRISSISLDRMTSPMPSVASPRKTS